MEILYQRLSTRICKEYGLSPEVAMRKAISLCQDCPSVLLPNLEQWAQGYSLSEIHIGPYSTAMVMEIWKLPDFLGAIEVLSQYAAGDCDTAERRIWRMRR